MDCGGHLSRLVGRSPRIGAEVSLHRLPSRAVRAANRSSARTEAHEKFYAVLQFVVDTEEEPALLLVGPTKAEGSGSPQGGVIGWSGHIGQTSPFTLSQTVKTTLSVGLSGFANSSLRLLRWGRSVSHLIHEELECERIYLA